MTASILTVLATVLLVGRLMFSPPFWYFICGVIGLCLSVWCLFWVWVFFQAAFLTFT